MYLSVLGHAITSLKILHYIGFDLYHCLEDYWKEQEFKHLLDQGTNKKTVSINTLKFNESNQQPFGVWGDAPTNRATQTRLNV